MKLNPHEIGTPLWDKLARHHADKLTKLRARIEQPRISEAERIELAWRIYAIKDFLALAEPAQKTETDAV